MFCSRTPSGKLRTRCAARRGGVAVEFAVIAPLVFLLIFATIEFGRGMMIVHTMEEAVRTGCRMAIVEGTTQSEVESTVQTLLNSNGVVNYTLSFTPNPITNSCQCYGQLRRCQLATSPDVSRRENSNGQLHAAAGRRSV